MQVQANDKATSYVLEIKYPKVEMNVLSGAIAFTQYSHGKKDFTAQIGGRILRERILSNGTIYPMWRSDLTKKICAKDFVDPTMREQMYDTLEQKIKEQYKELCQ